MSPEKLKELRDHPDRASAKDISELAEQAHDITTWSHELAVEAAKKAGAIEAPKLLLLAAIICGRVLRRTDEEMDADWKMARSFSGVLDSLCEIAKKERMKHDEQ